MDINVDIVKKLNEAVTLVREGKEDVFLDESNMRDYEKRAGKDIKRETGLILTADGYDSGKSERKYKNSEEISRIKSWFKHKGFRRTTIYDLINTEDDGWFVLNMGNGKEDAQVSFSAGMKKPSKSNVNKAIEIWLNTDF